MPISIYPPTIQSTQPAFLYTVTSYDIMFTLQQITAFADIGHIQVRVVKQSNNRSIVNTSLYPDGTIYKRPSQIRPLTLGYSIPILRTDLAEDWQPGFLYKIQMRFGTTPMFDNISQFASWKQQQIDQQTFSEWSTVMVIKAISPPVIYIKNAEAVKEDVISTERTEPTLTPLFTGSYSIAQVNKESVDKYRFTLYSGKEADSFNMIESSGWLQHNDDVNSVDQHRFKNVLTNNEYYTVTYEIITINGYKDSAEPYTFLASRSYYAKLKGVELAVNGQISNSINDNLSIQTYCKENGCMQIYLKSEIALSGAFILTRSNEKTNYQVWEDLQYFIFNKREFNNDLLFNDFTIESGVKYKYAIQQENAAKMRTEPVYDATNAPHYVDFEYSYLFHDGVQLKLLFNNKISTFKHTVLSSKQDTLGSKFPRILKNGYAYYAEFPISGLISFQMDEDQTFFNHLRYNDEQVIPSDKIHEEDIIRGPCAPGGASDDTGIIINPRIKINSNLTEDNIFVERKFREKVEEFLNNYDYKLFKSATEGNIVVVLTNVSMTPNATLGRMIYDFSATAYEVMENTLENLNKFGVINIGQFETLASDQIYQSFGQVSGIHGTVDIYSMIKEQEEVSVGEGYKTRLERIRSFWIERYPKYNFNSELIELYAKRSDMIKHNIDTQEIDNKIKELEDLQKLLNKDQNVNIVLNVNGTKVMILPNKMYSLREPVYSLQLVDTTYPIIVNYVCELTQQEDLSVGVISAIDTSRIWGQISGIFTGTDKVLRTYNYDYKPGQPPLRVYNRNPDSTVLYDPLGNRILDNTTFNVYKTVNLLDVVKEETRKQVEVIYNINGGFKQDEEGKWTDGTIYYEFSDIILFDIEADTGTSILISEKEDGSNPKRIIIGPTQRYILNPSDALIKYLALEPTEFERLVPTFESNVTRYEIPCRLDTNVFKVDISNLLNAGFKVRQIDFMRGNDIVATYDCPSRFISGQEYIQKAIYEHEYSNITEISQLGINLHLDGQIYNYARKVHKELAPHFCIVNYKCLTSQMKMMKRGEG